MKPIDTFGFIDEPQYRTSCSRAWLANYLRACRTQSYLHLKRTPEGYLVMHSFSPVAAEILRHTTH